MIKNKDNEMKNFFREMLEIQKESQKLFVNDIKREFIEIKDLFKEKTEGLKEKSSEVSKGNDFN